MDQVIAVLKPKVSAAQPHVLDAADSEKILEEARRLQPASNRERKVWPPLRPIDGANI